MKPGGTHKVVSAGKASNRGDLNPAALANRPAKGETLVREEAATSPSETEKEEVVKAPLAV